MNTLENMMRFGRMDNILDECIDECSKADLADCVKLLALNLAEYRSRYGPLPAPDLRRLLTDRLTDEGTARVLGEGMLQCAIALAQILGRTDVLDRIRGLEGGADADREGIGQATDGRSKSAPSPLHFQGERFFHHTSMGGEDDGWYFSVRGGLVYGPFPDEETARRILQGLIRHYQQHKVTGGR